MEQSRAAIATSRTPPPSAAAAIVRRFLVWTQRASAVEREQAASALARAYLHADLTGALREECAVAMAALLDDPHVAVRRSLAEAFAAARGAPRALVVALANDRSEIGAPLLARSPLLTDAELVDCIAGGDAVAQCAVARRPRLGAGPAAALAEVGTREAALTLIGNPDATLRPTACKRLLDRFGEDAEIRQALAARTDLPPLVEAEIALAATEAVDGSPATCQRATRDAALSAIAAACPDDELSELVRTLRFRGALTMALLLRSLLGGERAFFVAALAELSGLPLARAAGFVRDPRGAGFAAAALKAGLPQHALTVFRAALVAIATHGAGQRHGLKSELVRSVIGACEAEGNPALAPFLALLWRLAAEAARKDARATSREAVDRQVVLPPVLDFAPANDDAEKGEGVAPVLGPARCHDPGDFAPPVELPADLVLALNAA